jgi:hypothetical protein
MFMLCAEWIAILMLIAKCVSKACKIVEVDYRFFGPFYAWMLGHSSGQRLAWCAAVQILTNSRANDWSLYKCGAKHLRRFQNHFDNMLVAMISGLLEIMLCRMMLVR